MATKTAHASGAERLELLFSQWRTMRELQLQFIEKLGRYKLAVAQAELVQAVTASQWAVARMKAQVARELERALRGVQRLRRQTQRRLRRLDRQARDAAKVRSGEQLPASQLPHVWAAYTVFERAVPHEVLQRLVDTPLDPLARQGSSYANLRDPQRGCADPPADVTNVHALLHWLRCQGYLPRRGTRAYRQVVQAFAEIASVAETEVQQLQTALRQLEQETFDIWKPLVLAALPDSVDVKRITRIDKP